MRSLRRFAAVLLIPALILDANFVRAVAEISDGKSLVRSELPFSYQTLTLEFLSALRPELGPQRRTAELHYFSPVLRAIRYTGVRRFFFTGISLMISCLSVGATHAAGLAGPAWRAVEKTTFNGHGLGGLFALVSAGVMAVFTYDPVLRSLRPGERRTIVPELESLSSIIPEDQEDPPLPKIVISVTDMHELGVRMKRPTEAVKPLNLYQALPLSAMTLIASLPVGAPQVSIPHEKELDIGFTIQRERPQQPLGLIVHYVFDRATQLYSAAGCFYRESGSAPEKYLPMARFHEVAQTYASQQNGALVPRRDEHAYYAPTLDEWRTINDDGGFTETYSDEGSRKLTEKLVRQSRQGGLPSGRKTNAPAGIIYRVPVYEGARDGLRHGIFAKVQVTLDPAPGPESHWISYDEYVAYRARRSRRPSQIMPDFEDWLAQTARAWGFKSFLFSTGMRFGNLREWWGKFFYRRLTQHEGDDLARGENEAGEIVEAQQGQPVFAVADGEAVHLYPDHMAQSLIIRYPKIRNRYGDRYHSIHVHFRPTAKFQALAQMQSKGQTIRVRKDQLLGYIDKEPGKVASAPFHHHYTEAWIPGNIDWSRVKPEETWNKINPNFSQIYLVNPFEGVPGIRRLVEKPDDIAFEYWPGRPPPAEPEFHERRPSPTFTPGGADSLPAAPYTAAPSREKAAGGMGLGVSIWAAGFEPPEARAHTPFDHWTAHSRHGPHYSALRLDDQGPPVWTTEKRRQEFVGLSVSVDATGLPHVDTVWSTDPDPLFQQKWRRPIDEAALLWQEYLGSLKLDDLRRRFPFRYADYEIRFRSDRQTAVLVSRGDGHIIHLNEFAFQQPPDALAFVINHESFDDDWSAIHEDVKMRQWIVKRTSPGAKVRKFPDHPYLLFLARLGAVPTKAHDAALAKLILEEAWKRFSYFVGAQRRSSARAVAVALDKALSQLFAELTGPAAAPLREFQGLLPMVVSRLLDNAAELGMSCLICSKLSDAFSPETFAGRAIAELVSGQAVTVWTRPNLVRKLEHWSRNKKYGLTLENVMLAVVGKDPGASITPADQIDAAQNRRYHLQMKLQDFGHPIIRNEFSVIYRELNAEEITTAPSGSLFLLKSEKAVLEDALVIALGPFAGVPVYLAASSYQTPELFTFDDLIGPDNQFFAVRNASAPLSKVLKEMKSLLSQTLVITPSPSRIAASVALLRKLASAPDNRGHYSPLKMSA